MDKCPMMFPQQGYTQHGLDTDTGCCILDRCAWYDYDKKNCIMISIAGWLYSLREGMWLGK